jgi:hypothetical protein
MAIGKGVRRGIGHGVNCGLAILDMVVFGVVRRVNNLTKSLGLKMVGSVALQGTTSRLSESIKSQVGQERSH